MNTRQRAGLVSDALLIVAVAVIMLVITACQSYVSPQSTQDKVFSGYATMTASYKTIADMANRHVITKEQGRVYINRVDQAKAYLDLAAYQVNQGADSSAQEALSLAVAILAELEAKLKEVEHGPGTTTRTNQ